MTESKARKRRRAEARVTARCDPVCVECNQLATDLVRGAEVYPHRPDLAHKRIWRCACGATVGCHPGTELALGRPAGPATQDARRRAHIAFDDLWKRKSARDGCSRKEARTAGYVWLASAMGLPAGQCHVGWMTKAQALQVVELCRPFRRP